MTAERRSVAPSSAEALVIADLIEEFAARLQAGESINADSFAAEHPAYAAKLRELLPGVQVLADLEPSGSNADSEDNLAEAREGTLSGVLGDFRIIREVGKGGMGVVYEAEQISLRRRVALKVLPFAATMDARHLQRFHNEAQAAACLHHTNIVPVFSVGSERGVHFYAMQFIDGQPLSAIIRQLRRTEKPESAEASEHTAAYQPPPDGAIAAAPTVRPVAEATPLTSEGRRGRDYYRKVAELGVQTAEALDHAHQLGIVHRDVKPANLLLDGRGNLWVTDFGLAQMQHGEASLTMTGDIVGTLRYMSPEQALAKRVVIDHRTDVYSLGVTLYELLTLQPAVGGKDREELLQQIAFQEAKAPRRLHKAIPAELEIIVLKAMEKRPQDRYATAQELADDLRRWLLDQPIRARRPSWVQGARKWARRHQPAVWSASLLLLILMIVGFVNALWWVQLKTAAEIEAATKLTEAETEARAALQEAVRWQGEERWSEALSTIRRAQAVLRGFGVDATLQQQLDELGKDLEMAQRLEEARLQNASVKDGHFDFEGCIAAYVEAFAWYGLDVKHGDAGAAAEYIRSRSIRMQLVAALDFWANRLGGSGSKRQERTHLRAVARAADADVWRNRLRDALERQDGKALDDLLASAEVEKLLPSTLDLLPSVEMEHVKVASKRVAALLRRVQQRYPDDVWINHDLAWFLHVAQPPQLEEAIGYYRAAIALRPRSPGAHVNIGVALRQKGQLDEAIAEYREAIRIKKDYAEAHYNLGNALSEKGQLDQAVVEYREAIRIKEEYAKAHFNLGNALYHKRQLEEAIVEYREAIRLKEDKAEAHYNLGDALRDKLHLDEAIAEYREAIRIKKDFAEAHCNLGAVLERKGQFVEALEYRRRGHKLGSKNPRWQYPSAQWVRNCERLLELDGKLPAILSGEKQPADNAERIALARLCQLPCKQQYLAAKRFYSAAFAEEPKLADDLNAEHRYNAACAAVLAGCGQGRDADNLDSKERARLRQQALDWLRDDLKAYRQVMERSAGKASPEIAQRMKHWLQDGDFAGVRGDNALATLPEEERSAWRKLWADVAELLAKSQGKALAEKKPDTK